MKRIKKNIFKEADRACRYIKPKIDDMPDKFVKFSHAQEFVDAIDFKAGYRVHAIVNGSFVFGDLIEAFLTKYRISTKKMTLCTLSYNNENVCSLKLLREKGYIEKLNIITSDYFFSHERRGLIPYTYYQLDNEDGTFQLAVERTHIKCYIFETKLHGSKFVIQGSGNLRSSGNSEQFTMEINPQLYDYYDNYFEEILNRQKTIDYSVKYGKDLWRKILNKINKEQDEVGTDDHENIDVKKAFKSFKF